MEKHFLEKASWVAGIVSAAIAFVVWVRPDHSASQEQMEQNQNAVAPALAPANSQKTIKPVDKPALVEPVTKPPARWSCGGVARDLESAFEAAKKISYTDPRDNAFLALARRALCIENHEMFERAAKQISYTDPRDKAYGDAVDFTLNLKKFDLANKYASQIAYTELRDAAMARIVAKSSER